MGNITGYAVSHGMALRHSAQMKLTMGHFRTWSFSTLFWCSTVGDQYSYSGMLEAAPSARQIEIVVEHIACIPWWCAPADSPCVFFFPLINWTQLQQTPWPGCATSNAVQITARTQTGRWALGASHGQIILWCARLR